MNIFKIFIKVGVLIILFSQNVIAQTTAGEYDISILKENSENSDFGTTFYGENKIIFSSSKNDSGKKKWENGQGFLDLYEAEIQENGQLDNVKKLASRVNSQYHESNVAFSSDGKTVYFSRNNSKLAEETVNKKVKHSRRKKSKKSAVKTSKIGLYSAKVDSRGNWSNITLLPFNKSTFSTGHPTVSADGKKLYFSSDRYSTPGISDIYVVDILEDGMFSKPKNLGTKINTAGREMFPFIDKKNILYFASDGHRDGFGGLDVYAVKIYENSFSEVLHLGSPINTPMDDFCFIVNNENNEGYFSSNRENGVGDDDIYHFVSDPPLSFECAQKVSGIVTDSKTSKPLKNVQIVATSKDGIVKKTKTNNNGAYSLYLDCSNTFSIKTAIANYDSALESVTTTKGLNEKHKANFELTSNLCEKMVTGVVKDTKTGKFLLNAQIVLMQDEKVIEILKLNQRGEYKVTLNCGLDYSINVSENGYKKIKKAPNTLKSAPNKQIINFSMGAEYCEKTVSGVVLDSNTQLPIENVIIYIVNRLDGSKKVEVSTNTQGRYSIALECDNEYYVSVVKSKYETKDTLFHVKNSNLNFDLELKPAFQEVLVVRNKVIVNIQPIYFDLNQFNIRPDAMIELDKVITIMRKYPNLKIEGGSHTDSRGSNTNNQKLSLKRASATVAYIVRQGISPSRISAKGYGESEIMNRCANGVKCSKNEHQQNRRTEFAILNPEILGDY